MDYLSVSEAAQRSGARPKDISDLFCERTIGDDTHPIVADRPLIPDGYLDVIRLALKRACQPTGGETGVELE